MNAISRGENRPEGNSAGVRSEGASTHRVNVLLFSSRNYSNGTRKAFDQKVEE